MILLVVACTALLIYFCHDGTFSLVSAQVLHIAYLWSNRHGGETPEKDTECVFDSLIAASYAARGSLELGLATQECPEIDEISRELTKEIAKIAAPKRKLQDPLQELPQRLAAPVTPENASLQVERALARANDVLQTLHLKDAINRSGAKSLVNRSVHDLVTRRLNEEKKEGHHEEHSDEESEEAIREVAELKIEKEVQGSLCGLEIAGLIGSYAWVAAYLAAATTECISMLYLDRYCASDISRVIAASADIAQAANGMYTACTDDRSVRHAERRLSNRSSARQSAVLPPSSPQDEILLRMASESSKRPLTKDGRKKVKTIKKNLLQAECGVNAVQGALFIGRAALELSGVAEHCVEHFDFYETIRCAANAQGSLAAFAVASHVFAEAIAQCKDSINDLDLNAYCAGSVAQIVHATLELTAALTLLAEYCTLLKRFPFGRPEDNLRARMPYSHIFHR